MFAINNYFYFSLNADRAVYEEYLIRLNMAVSDKHSSLSCQSIVNMEKSFSTSTKNKELVGKPKL